MKEVNREISNEELDLIEPLSYSKLNSSLSDSTKEIRIKEEKCINNIRPQQLNEYCDKYKVTEDALYLSIYALLINLYCRPGADFFILFRIEARKDQLIIIKHNLINNDLDFKDLLDDVSRQVDSSLEITKEEDLNHLFEGRIFSYQSSTNCVDNKSDYITLVNESSELFISLSFEFESIIFDSYLFLDRFENLLLQVLEIREIKNSEIFFLLEQEKVFYQQTTQPSYDDSCLRDWLKRAFGKFANNCAIKKGNESISYAELEQLSNQLANAIIENSSCYQLKRIAVCGSPGIEFIIAVIATIKTGAAYIPIDISYPFERIRYILEDSSAQAVIVTSEISQKVEEIKSDIDIYHLNINEWSFSNISKEFNSKNSLDLENILYIIYTSGSTGKPKGAGVKNRGELNLLYWYIEEFGLTSVDSFFIISAVGFDLTQKNIFAPLLVGGTIIFSESTVYDDSIYIQEINNHKVTCINCAPSAFYPIVTRNEFEKLSSLRQVFFGGESIRLSAMLPWLSSKQCNASLVNMYGPTECTDIAASYIVNDPEEYINSTIPIGKPNDNVKLYVVDQLFRLVPPGLIGELCIGGEGVGIGYIGRPDLNAEKFCHMDLDEGLIYKTGDLVRLGAEENYHFLSRIDFQVKLRGLRVELGEVEQALKEIVAAEDCVALVENDNLIVYMLVNNIADFFDWRSRLASILPDYITPQKLIALLQWPLTPNGKVDRKALPKTRDYKQGVGFDISQFEKRLELCDCVEKLVLITVGGNQIQEIVAFFTEAQNFELSGNCLEAVKRYVEQQLPEFLHPDKYVLLESFPIEKGGEVNRLALLDSIVKPADSEGERLSDSEKVLIDEIENVLGITGVTLSDNFYDLGGQSLVALALIEKVEKRFDVRVPPADLVVSQIKQLAQTLDRNRSYQDGLKFYHSVELNSKKPEITMEPFYFEGEAGSLYAVYHKNILTSTKKDHAILLCYPHGQEYMRAHRAFRILAAKFNQYGFPVLRFDYSGTGDSNMQNPRLNLWVEDVVSAAKKLTELSGCSKISLVGLRMGGIIAAKASDAISNLENLVLWDSLNSGEAYLQELITYIELNENNHSNFVSDKGLICINGFFINEQLAADLKAYELKENHIKSKKIFQIVSSETRASEALKDQLEGHSGYNYCYAEAPGNWNYVDHVGGIMVPQPIIKNIIEWFQHVD